EPAWYLLPSAACARQLYRLSRIERTFSVYHAPKRSSIPQFSPIMKIGSSSVILSAAKDLSAPGETLRYAQGDTRFSPIMNIGSSSVILSEAKDLSAPGETLSAAKGDTRFSPIMHICSSSVILSEAKDLSVPGDRRFI